MDDVHPIFKIDPRVWYSDVNKKVSLVLRYAFSSSVSLVVVGLAHLSLLSRWSLTVLVPQLTAMAG